MKSSQNAREYYRTGEIERIERVVLPFRTPYLSLAI